MLVGTIKRTEVRHLTPVRLLILAVLFYLAYRVITSGSRKKREKKPADKASAAGIGVDDILVEDPFCHTLVPQKGAISMQVDGKTLYFCSKDCLSQYLAEQGDHA